MANSVKGIKELKKCAEKIETIKDGLQKKATEYANIDGMTLAYTMQDGYNTYANTEKVEGWKSTYGGRFNRKSAANWEFISKTPAELGEAYGAVPFCIPKANGCTFGIRGKDVVYFEYGTGAVGAANPHPAVKNAGYVYNVGPGIINHGSKEHFRGNSMKWYSSLVRYPGFEYLSGNSLWIHNTIARDGMRPGKFVYNTVTAYRNFLASQSSEIHGMSGFGALGAYTPGSNKKYRLTKSAMTAYIKEVLSK